MRFIKVRLARYWAGDGPNRVILSDLFCATNLLHEMPLIVSSSRRSLRRQQRLCQRLRVPSVRGKLRCFTPTTTIVSRSSHPSSRKYCVSCFPRARANVFPRSEQKRRGISCCLSVAAANATSSFIFSWHLPFCLRACHTRLFALPPRRPEIKKIVFLPLFFSLRVRVAPLLPELSRVALPSRQ